MKVEKSKKYVLKELIYMSYTDGLAAINLEMPGRVPRTEYSAANHWDLVKVVTGIPVDAKSSQQLQQKAMATFIKAWNFDFNWSTLIHNQVLEKKRTKMGHAAYASAGVDFNEEIECPFEDSEDVLAFDPVEVYGTIDQPLWTKKFNEHYQGTPSS